jgi:hypothetical protein
MAGIVVLPQAGVSGADWPKDNQHGQKWSGVFRAPELQPALYESYLHIRLVVDAFVKGNRVGAGWDEHDSKIAPQLLSTRFQHPFLILNTADCTNSSRPSPGPVHLPDIEIDGTLCILRRGAGVQVEASKLS